jgi:hypothetical protein
VEEKQQLEFILELVTRDMEELEEVNSIRSHSKPLSKFQNLECVGLGCSKLHIRGSRFLDFLDFQFPTTEFGSAKEFYDQNRTGFLFSCLPFRK